MKKTYVVSLLATVLGCLAAPSAQAAAGRFSLTTGLDYSTGKYGGSTATDIWYVPVVGKYETGPWTLKLTVPYIRVTGPGNVVRDVGTLRSSSAVRTTQSGMGDIVAAATYNLDDGRRSGTVWDLTGKVKFGTADDARGLGTGENDYAAQVDVYKTIDRTTLFATLGYRAMGDPPGTNLDNVLYGSLGFSYRLSPATNAGLIFDGREKTSLAGAAQEELTAFVSQKYGENWKTQYYVVKGFANGSPDWGVGAMMTYLF